jgi:RNA polymerase sigma factor (sigma-70 family)
MNKTSSSRAVSDEQLWRASRAGDRDAFGRIVERYQSLVCALAYSGTGDLATSQDLAQEAFLAAWRRLGELREPEKLRSWLCGIVRNLAAGTVRRDLRRGGVPQPLDAIADPVSQHDDPEAEFVTREEEAILWRALAAMPDTYREPMVLFYREEQSIADVATKLDLSEDAVKQRLSRGRAMLREEMAALVESALTRSRPTAAFTASVMGALTLGTGSSVSAAGTAGPIVATAAKSVAGSLGPGAVAGPLAGLLTAWLSSKAVGLTARSEPERALIAQAFASAIPFVFGMIAVLLAIIYLGLRTSATSPWFFATTSVVWSVALLVGIFRLAWRYEREIARVRVETGTEDAAYAEVLAKRGLELAGSKRRESTFRFLRLPLYCFSSMGLEVGPQQSRAARGWIAVGDVAISPVLAIGGIAIAPIAVGGLTVGAVSIGGAAIGLLALGSLAAGWCAFGPVAVAWKAAAGGVAIARDYAVGGLVRAAEANTAAAAEWFGAQWFTAAVAIFFFRIAVWLIFLSILIPIGWILYRAWRLHR